MYIKDLFYLQLNGYYRIHNWPHPLGGEGKKCVDVTPTPLILPVYIPIDVPTNIEMPSIINCTHAKDKDGEVEDWSNLKVDVEFSEAFTIQFSALQTQNDLRIQLSDDQKEQLKQMNMAVHRASYYREMSQYILRYPGVTGEKTYYIIVECT